MVLPKRLKTLCQEDMKDLPTQTSLMELEFQEQLSTINSEKTTWRLPQMSQELPGNPPEMLQEPLLPNNKRINLSTTKWSLRTMLMMLLRLTRRNGTILLHRSTWRTVELPHSEQSPTLLLCKLQMSQELPGKPPEMPLELLPLSKKDSNWSTTKWLPRTTLMMFLPPTPKNGTTPPPKSTWRTEELLHSRLLLTLDLTLCMLKTQLVHLMLPSFQAKLKPLPLSTLNNLSKLPRPLMLPQEMMPTPTLLILLKLMLETLEMFKLLEKFHITHTQLENNGLDNQQTDSCKFNPNILMDLTQSIFTNPTELTPTEITKPLKLRVQLFQKSNKDGNPWLTLTTGLKKLRPDNKDGLMRSTHGLRNSPSDKMICQKLTKLIPV